jgi:nucleoside-diphosphate-sugar epimerase
LGGAAVRVLVTGATGFIGSHVSRTLVQLGHDVYALVRPESDLWRIEDLLPSLHLLQGDLLAVDGLRGKLDEIRPDLCVHLAWYTEPGKYLISEENIELLRASLQLLACLSRFKCKRFVGVGTCSEYDTRAGYLSETSAVHPESLYAASKLAMSLVLEQVGKATGMDTSWIRLFYQYGPFEDERRVVPSVICALLRKQRAKVTEGGQARDFLHVEDVARAIVAVALSDLRGVVNVASGQPTTVRHVVTRIGEMLGRSELIEFGALPTHPSDPMFICGRNHRLMSTGWAPTYDLEKGLQHTITWWQRRLGTA